MTDEIFRFLKKLTFRKLFNFLKVESGYCISRLAKKPIIWGNPYSFSIEPTSRCNLHCPQCPTGLGTLNRKQGELSMENYRSLIDDVAPNAIYLMLYLQGEPFLNPQFFEMVHYAHVKNIYTCTSTNAHFLDKKNAQKLINSQLDRIIISLDGITQEVYQQYRKGGSLQVVLNGIRNLVQAKRESNCKNPTILLQFIVFKHNEHQMEGFKKLAADLQVDKWEFKSAQLYEGKGSREMIPVSNRYSRYKHESDGYRLKKKIKNTCHRIFSTAAITNEGKLISCCYDKDGDFTMGTLPTQNLNGLWRNQPFQLFRQQILKKRDKFDMCRNCNE